MFGCVDPNAHSYRDLTPRQIYNKHENEEKRQYAEKVMEIEQGTFTPLVFTTTGGMVDECVKYHSRLEGLIANKKGVSYGLLLRLVDTGYFENVLHKTNPR